MKSSLMVASLAALLMVVSPALAENSKPKESSSKESTSKPAKAEAALKPPYSMIAGQLKLSDDMKASIAQKTKLLYDWQAANQEKMTAAEKAVKDAKAGDDKDALAKAQAALKPIKDEEKALQVKVRKEVMDLLTDDQKADWVGAETGNMIKGHLSKLAGKKIEFTDEQAAKFKDLAKAAAKEILALKDADEKATKAIREKLMADVKEKVLTDEQRKALEAKAAEEPKPTEKPKLRPIEMKATSGEATETSKSPK